MKNNDILNYVSYKLYYVKWIQMDVEKYRCGMWNLYRWAQYIYCSWLSIQRVST